MFEKYTEKARRVIFFGRYEASQFGSSRIEKQLHLKHNIPEKQVVAREHIEEALARWMGLPIEAIREATGKLEIETQKLIPKKPKRRKSP